MLSYTKALMIGRQALKEPFIFGIIRGKKYSVEKEKIKCIFKYINYAKIYNVGFQQIKIHIQSLLKDTRYSKYITQLTHLKNKDGIIKLVESILPI